MFSKLKTILLVATGAGFLLLSIATKFQLLKVDKLQAQAETQSIKKESTIKITDLNTKVEGLAKTNSVLAQKVAATTQLESEQRHDIESLQATLRETKVDLSDRIAHLRNVTARVKAIALERPDSLTRLVNKRNSKLFKRAMKTTSV